MIRIICANNDFADAANVGGPATVTHKTFDVELPEVEAWLREHVKYHSRSFQGIELIPPQKKEWP